MSQIDISDAFDSGNIEVLSVDGASARLAIHRGSASRPMRSASSC